MDTSLPIAELSLELSFDFQFCVCFHIFATLSTAGCATCVMSRPGKTNSDRSLLARRWHNVHVVTSI